MTTLPMQSRGASNGRAVPWSTRAVIFLAVAIQLGQIGERLAAPPVGPADCLTLCNGRILAILYDTADAQQAAAVEAASAMVRLGAADGVWSVAGGGLVAPRGLERLSPSLLPLPPPAVC